MVLFAGLIYAAMPPDHALAQPRQSAVGGKSRGLAFDEARNKMVDEEIVGAGVKNPRVIAAMRATPRHEFVPDSSAADSRMTRRTTTWRCRSARGRRSRRRSLWPT